MVLTILNDMPVSLTPGWAPSWYAMQPGVVEHAARQSRTPHVPCDVTESPVHARPLMSSAKSGSSDPL